MKKLQVRFSKSPDHNPLVGTLAEQRGQVFFEYDEAFVQTGLNLSPFRLPFNSELFEHMDVKFGPLPGLFDDSLPDGWGLLLMDRHFRKLGLIPQTLSPLDRLSFLGSRTMGALTYFPPQDLDEIDTEIFQLHDLALQSEKILSGQAMEVLPQLLRAGGSPGGARPKVLVNYAPQTGELLSGACDPSDGFEPWIVKFPAKSDEPEAGSVEYAYALMAKAAGIEMPEVRLFETAEGDRFFGCKRFDRDGLRRIHTHSFGNLIQSNFRIPSNDYEDLLKVTSILTRNQRDVIRAFRQMVFNIIAHNRDDHVKNFAFLLDDDNLDWHLSPAYDLSFSMGPGGEHSMTVAGEGREPNLSQVFELAKKAGLRQKEARSIVEEVSDVVNRWNDFAAEADLLNTTKREIKGSFLTLSSMN